MLDLNNKGFCIFGLPDSGKSTLAHFLLASYAAGALVYDTLSEYPDTPFDCYRPKDRASVAELEIVTRAVLKAKRYKMYVIDECNRYCPSKPAPLPQAIADLNDWRAHYRLTAGYICRRPTQLNQDLTELAHYLFIFGLRGKNDIQHLNDVAAGLGDAVATLPKYHFMVVNPDRTFTHYKPIPAKFKTQKKLNA